MAAMGPEVDAAAAAAGSIRRFLLKPFASSQTAANLLRSRAAVFHAVDDALLVARVVVGALDAPPPHRPATVIAGFILDAACRSWELEVVPADTTGQRWRLDAHVVAEHEGRPFVGLSRARHAVMEGAILVSRLHLLGAEEVGRQLRLLAPLVEKTGGPREQEAFGLLEARAAAWRASEMG